MIKNNMVHWENIKNLVEDEFAWNTRCVNDDFRPFDHALFVNLYNSAIERELHQFAESVEDAIFTLEQIKEQCDMVQEELNKAKDEGYDKVKDPEWERMLSVPQTL